MAFYDLSKTEREQLVAQITEAIRSDFKNKSSLNLEVYFSDEDTYIRKNAYLAVGKIYNANLYLQQIILEMLRNLFERENEKIRQTVVNAAGEIGKYYFEDVVWFFDNGLFDEHHCVRNAVIGSVKKMSEKNPKPILNWAKQYLHHDDKEVRREICHGIELRGRTHPEDILPLLKELQNDTTKRVRNTLIHVIGQISYKKNCLPKVIVHLNSWENKMLVLDALDEIVDVHSEKRYAKFSALSQEEVITYIDLNFKK
ncbi:HEAT repeats [Flavobacterium sp. 9AF]|uniref:HEAT repeat domain-containing protein n=1 Tax=Flavobacterium sp. 9AF TaxID=2653142 RepID=UPI0012F018E0|nr:HEAT repeat domain-containing protein [Flavobacterium sp. 9AF]VXB42500.1 HEAT repeats [Flavobacterium sp. 9AF]